MSDALAMLRDPYIQVTYLFVAGVAAIYCLIGLWAATSRRHWFVRAIVPCLALAALIPIRAHEPLIFYAMIMGEIVAAMTLWRWWRTVGPACRAGPESPSDADPRSRSASGIYQRFRFGLRDLFLVMIVAGVIAWIVTGFAGVGRLIEWPYAIVASLLLAALTLCAWNAVTARRRGPALGLLLVVFLLAVAIDVTLLGNWLKLSSFLHTGESWRWWQHDAAILSYLYGEFTAMALSALILIRAASNAATSRSRRIASRLMIAAACLAGAVPLGTLYRQMLHVPAFPPALKLSENVYPQVLEIGAPMEAMLPTRAAATYQRLVPLLDRPGHLTVEPAQVRRDPLGYELLPRAQLFRSIARSMDGQASAFAAQGKHDEAAECALSILKLVRMQSRGGMPVDTIVGHAVEGVGHARIARLRNKLSRPVRIEAMKLLEQIDAEREPAELVARRDAAYYSQGMRWLYALETQRPFDVFGASLNPTADFLGPPIDVIRSLDDSQKRQQAPCRLLCADLAIRLFQDDRGRLPQSLEELVPDYFTAVPIDPYAGRPLVYRPDGESFVLYSVGPDGIDNDGTPKPKGQGSTAANIDWDLDSLFAP